MKISVAMCTYNGEVFLEQQIDSILNQTMKVNEIVVCDDGSNDRTHLILEKYSLKFPNLFRIYKNEINLRSVKNFEKAISLCTGDYIFLSDQDDIWVNIKVNDYVTYFKQNIRIDVIASNGFCIDDDGKVKEKYAIWDVPEFLKERNINFKYYELILMVANIATGASMAFRKSVIQKILPIPIINGFHHDEWIAIISSIKNSFTLLNEKYFYYRIHSNQQLGGVFYNKTPKVKKELINNFDLNEKCYHFKDYKRRLKKLCYWYEKNKYLTKIETDKTDFFVILNEIENNYYNCKKIMSSKYPIKSFLLNKIDGYTHKRQLKN